MDDRTVQETGVDAGRAAAPRPGVAVAAGLALAHGGLLAVWSELVFWGGPVEGILSPVPFGMTLLAYTLAGVVVTVPLAWPSTRPAASVLLGGALFGVLVEGVVEGTLYMDLPLSVSWTGLAWHMTIAVFLGWYALPRLLARPRRVPWLLAIGAAWGAWAAFWPNERPWFGVVAFGLYAHGTAALAAVAVALADRLPAAPPPRWLLIPALALAAVAFAGKVATFGPLALLAPVLAALSVVGLVRLRDPAGRAPLAARRCGLGGWAYARLVLVPLAATSVYGAFAAANVAPPTNIVLYLITVPLGFGLWLGALALALFARTPRSAARRDGDAQDVGRLQRGGDVGRDHRPAGS